MPLAKEYAKPPILEAVFEVQFSDGLSSGDLDRLKRRFETDYPSVQTRQNVTIEVGEKSTSSNATLLGFEMSAGNAIDVVLIQKNSFGTIRRAPYTKWEELISKAKVNYDEFVKIAGRRQISRLGSRFINRMDISSNDLAGKDLTEWLKLGIVMPEEISKSIGPYSLAVNVIVGKNVKALVQSGLAPTPALLNHASFNLDIDVFIDEKIGMHKEAIWQHAEDLRDAKNIIFEGSITDKLRAYFK